MMGEGYAMAGQPVQHITLARQAAATIMQVLKRVPAIDSFDESGARPSSVEGAIEVREVTFAYPTAPTHNVCSGFSLSIAAGQTVALCGPSGSGKSTIIALLERFYDPQAGALLLDGADLRTLNVRWLRSQLGLVGQEPVLFQGSVRENIAYGASGEVSDDEIMRAESQANAHIFVTENLANGYDTQVGLGGSKLSGGQKQRVAIARALVRQPAVLLLDEATSALDNESEKIVQAALDSIMATQKHTTVMIAHRISTIRDADMIAVLKEGAVVEAGTYDELMANADGLFYSLEKAQAELHAKDRATVHSTVERQSVQQVDAVVHTAEPAAEGRPPPEGKDVEQGAVVPAMASASPGEVASSKVDGDAAPRRQRRRFAGVCGGGKVAEAEESSAGEEEPEEKAPVGRLFKMQADQSASLVLMCLFSGAAAVGPPIAFYFMVEVIAILYLPSGEQMRDDALFWAVVLFGMAAGITLCFFCSGFFNGKAGSALTAKLRALGMDALLRQEMSFYDAEENTATELTGFLAEKVDKVKTITTEVLDLAVQLLAGTAAVVVIIFWLCSWQLALVFLAIIPVMGVIMQMQMVFMTGGKEEADKRKGKEDTSKRSLANASANQIVGEAVSSIRTVASLNLEQRLYSEYCESTATVSALAQRDAAVAGFFNGLTMAALVG